MSNEGDTQPNAAQARKREENYREALAQLLSDFLLMDPEQFVEEAAQLAREGETGRLDGWVQTGAAICLMLLGSLVVIATILFKYWFLLGQLSSILPSELLLPSEFITGISLGTILVAFGAFLSLYKYKVRAESVRINLRNRAEIIRRLAASAQRHS